MKIMILGIHHLRHTNDMHVTDFGDSFDRIKLETDEVVNKVMAFSPTAIAVEIDRSNQSQINELYSSFENRDLAIDERDLLAFPLAKKTQSC